MQKRALLEIAVDNIGDAIAAVEAGADRLEVVADLLSHGLSPRPEFVAELKRALAGEGGQTVPLMAMVRPGPGSFVATPKLVARLMNQAEDLLASGADGIVFGALDPAGHIDREAVRLLVRTAGTRETVFHRAFDLCPDPLGSLNVLKDHGVTRILTSGLDVRATAIALGLEEAGEVDAACALSGALGGASLPMRLRRIRAFVEAAQGEMEVLPCGGVRSHNVVQFLTDTGCGQVHSACRRAGADRLSRDEAAVIRRAIDAV